VRARVRVRACVVFFFLWLPVEIQLLEFISVMICCIWVNAVHICFLLISSTSIKIMWFWMYVVQLTLILLTWSIGWAPNNARKWQMGFNSAFKGLTQWNWEYIGCSLSTMVIVLFFAVQFTKFQHVH